VKLPSLSIPSLETIVRYTIGAAAALAAMFLTYWAMVVLTFILSWVLAILGMALAGAWAFNRAQGDGYDWLADRAASLVNLVRPSRAAVAE
jgi:hypothetical protein